MLKMKIDIAAPNDIESARLTFSRNLAKSSLQGTQAEHLSEQVGITLDQFEKQLKNKSDKHVNVSRVLEGDGYSIKFVMRSGRAGIFSQLAKAIGLG